ncbi:predicted protein [Naegleria gruberi]|uniref:Predicted protein n=1 Tax=Naegleria gruberi TaxID=5762 RepID=D2VLF4_NAEGR|nr:uncharacterized protein NAEGRDRAFT_50523 [Naegleria gruberi]EFC42376.1 predicted protein [Naegleria gruberi]|eukprot:XP_002675120.1 predicted protein [Naegleria gruberi strain NEG-M]
MSSQSLGSSLKFSESFEKIIQDSDEKLIMNINWIRLPVSVDPLGESFFVKFKTITNGFVLYISNMKCVWKKRYEKEEIESDSNKYCKGLNMSAESLVQQIEQFLIHYDLDSIQEKNQPKIEVRGEKNCEEETAMDMLMDSIQSVHASTLKKKRTKLVVTIRALLPTQVQISLPFYWEIHCDSIDPNISKGGEDQEEIDHSYILIQDEEENPKKRKQDQDENSQKSELNNIRFYNKENLFILNHVIRPLLGIVQTQNQQIDQMKSLLLKKEQELINFRQMYSGANNSTQNSDILDQLDKILLVSDSLGMCDISFTNSKTDSTESNKNPLLQQLYTKYMNHLFSPPKTSKKQKIADTREQSQHSFGGGINSQGNDSRLGGDDAGLIPEEVNEENNSSQMPNVSDNQPTNVVELSSSIPTTSQRSEYVETEEEKQRRIELEEKLNEKRKKKMANEQKKKIKNAFM